MSTETKDVLEQNVSTLIESGGEAPKLADAARTRIRAELVAKFGVAEAAPRTRARTPLAAIGFGLVATAAAGLVATRFVGHESPAVTDSASTTLADGSTFITAPGAKVSVLGPRRVRVDGAVLLDVAPGKGTFVVDTTRGRIEVLGTRFMVDGQADRTTAAVVRGEVKLATSSGDVVLHAGEQGVAEPGRPPVRGPAPRLSHIVSWAEHARHTDEHALEPLHHGTLFARDPGVRSHPPWGQEYPLPIKQLGLDIVVEDQVARVALDQTFHNNASQDLEGVYRFAIPADAALQRLAMYVDGKLIESAVVERMQARRIYEELVYRRVDPALLEWAGSGRLSLRVYPIPANQDKRLMLAYTQSLPKLYDDWTLTVPLPEVDQPVGAMDIAVRVKGCANCELMSTSHHIDVERAGDDAIVHYHHTGEKLGDSFVLHVRDPKHATTVATAADGDDHYLMVRAPVKLSTDAPAYRPRTWVILDDVSASRGPSELHAQQDLVDAFVRELDENDKLAVIAFDVDARQKLAPTRVMDVDRKALRTSLKREGGVGATDFGVALDAATKLLAGVAPDDAMIVYLGDGMITSGARNLDALRAQIAGKAHFVGVGVGDGPDLQTLGGLAAATGGYATTMDLADDLGWRAFDLVAALHTSRVTGLEAKLVDGGGNLVPATAYLGSQQLADGEELELVGKLAGGTTPTAVELTGTIAGAPWHTTIALPATLHTAAGYLPRLWAQHHIAARLLAKHEPVAIPPCDSVPATAGRMTLTCPTEAELREARDEQIRREVVGLGKRYFLLSRHTSLLVLENDDMYKQYGVTKGSGDTWAPYKMPSTIPVTATATPSTIAEDAELVRTPLQIFYNAGYSYGGFDGIALGQTRNWHANRDFAFDARLAGPLLPAGSTRGALRITNGERAHDKDTDQNGSTLQQVVTTGDLSGTMNGELVGGIGFGKSGYAEKEVWGRAIGGKSLSWAGGGGGGLMIARFAYAADVAFDDLSGFVPALFADATDTLRAALTPTKGKHTIDDAARALLADARRRLPAGVYRWGDRELALDDARRIGWRRTTETGLVETGSLDGTTWTRRYAELGLDVTRPVSDDDLAIALVALPIWIADPAHYARYFDVAARGRNIVLSTLVRGKSQTAYVLSFDDQARLVAIADAAGIKLVEVTWNATGPVAARVDGAAVSVGFTGEAIADASAWAQQGTQPGTLVALPGHLVAYWQAAIDKEVAGSPAWRHAQRQLLVSAAAVQDVSLAYPAFEALRTHGGVELGDLVLASAGIVRATDDEQFAAAIAPFATTPVGAYLASGRTYSRGGKAHGAPSGDGLVGALGHLRAVVAHYAAGESKAAVQEVLAMGDRALELRLVAAGASLNYQLDPNDVARIWDSVAVGEYKNVARMSAAQAFANRGQFEIAVERIGQLVADYDLDARPVQLANAQYFFNASRRGPAGWQIAWTTWRDRVLASTSYDQVVALVPAASQQPADLQRVFGRAIVLAGTDATRRLAVAHLAVSYGQNGLAASIVEPMLKVSPSHELYQFASNLALGQGRTAEALADLEAAQDIGADDVVDINVVRQELGQILNLTQRLAIESSGPDRTHAVDRAMIWGERWRAIDPGNTAIDQQLGELLLAVGDTAGAWRQLSSTIERDPWSGAGYMTVAESFERQGKVEAALPFWQQAIVIDQTDPTPRLRKAQALIALGRAREGDLLLHDIATQKWHPIWANVVSQAQDLIARGKH